uniref:N/A n=1 Tax=Ganoderma boninense TaxID=34458 RepID=A0A5K1K7H5_9APHY|nr:N/A [Ganoderma boninense]
MSDSSLHRLDLRINNILRKEVAIKLESVKAKHPQLEYESKVYRPSLAALVFPSSVDPLHRVHPLPQHHIHRDVKPDNFLIEESKPPLTPPTATLYTPNTTTTATQPTPHYAWTSGIPTSITPPFQEGRLANLRSPALSERSMHSNRSIHMPPSLSSAPTASSQESPIPIAATPLL